MPDHSFDGHGYFFAAKWIAAIVIVGSVTQAYVTTTRILPKAQSTTASVGSSTIAESETRSEVERIIPRLSLRDAVPVKGKFVGADLTQMKLHLYVDGAETEEFDIVSKGRPDTPFETPSGFYSVRLKEEDHFSSIGHVHMPYSMQFFGNYFIHGWPRYPSGKEVPASFSGGCIRLKTVDAEKVYDFVDRGTGIYVFDDEPSRPSAPLALTPFVTPEVHAQQYLVADIDTGHVYRENVIGTTSVYELTDLITAIVANETISFDTHVRIPLSDISTSTDAVSGSFPIGELLYPIILRQNGNVARALADHLGTSEFVRSMNTLAKALHMSNSHFSDPAGDFSENVSIPDDLYRLASYIADKKNFVWAISRTKAKKLSAYEGGSYMIANPNSLAEFPAYLGGAFSQSGAAQSEIALFKTAGAFPHRVVIIALQSEDATGDIKSMYSELSDAVKNAANSACTACASATYRTIEK